MGITSKEKFKIRRIISDLSSKNARHTELISVYVPAGYDLNKIQNQLSEEAGTARNIKSSTTRKNVQAALERMIRALKIYKKTPKNGLAIFSGNVAEREGKSDVKVWEIQPPVPLGTKIYKCDQKFYLSPLKNLVLTDESYGLIVIDRQEANVARLKGKSIIPIKNMDSVVPGKTRKGGQSSSRFRQVRQNLLKDFFKEVADVANKQLNSSKVKGILLGGPGPTKDMFLNGNFLNEEIKEKIIGVIDVGYTGEQGLEELVSKSKDILSKEEITEEKEVVNKFFDILNKKPAFSAYGEKEVKRALELGAVSTLLLSEDVDREKIDYLSEKVEETGGEWVLVSTKTKEGNLLQNLTGIAAILRFPCNQIT